MEGDGPPPVLKIKQAPQLPVKSLVRLLLSPGFPCKCGPISSRDPEANDNTPTHFFSMSPKRYKSIP